MRRTVLIGMLCLMVISSVDAESRRSRRARRRAARQSTSVQANWSRNYYRAPTTSPAVNPTRGISVPTNSEVIYSSEISSSSVAPLFDAAPQPVTVYKPVIDSVPATFSETSARGAESAPVASPAVESDVLVAVDAVPTPIPDVLPTVDDAATQAGGEPFCASCTVTPASQPFNSALAELNSIRAQRGLPALVEDPSLSAIAYQKASVQASRGAMYHPGGTMGGARYEGVGMGRQFTTCYQDATNVRYAGAATAVGRNGQRFHCLLVR